MLQITGKHIEVTDAIRNHAEELFQKVEEHNDLVHKSISFGKNRHLFEVVAQCETMDGFKATATAEDPDCYKAINFAVKKLLKQVDKQHSKYQKHEHRSLAEAVLLEEAANSEETVAIA